MVTREPTSAPIWGTRYIFSCTLDVSTWTFNIQHKNSAGSGGPSVTNQLPTPDTWLQGKGCSCIPDSSTEMKKKVTCYPHQALKMLKISFCRANVQLFWRWQEQRDSLWCKCWNAECSLNSSQAYAPLHVSFRLLLPYSRSWNWFHLSTHCGVTSK